MSQTLIIVGHPNQEGSQLNAEMAKFWASRPNTIVRWIGEGRVNVREEQAAFERAENIVLQFPLYWYGPPACLKQWMDDVLTWGWAFGKEGGLLNGRNLACSVTVGGNLADYSANGKHATTLDSLLEPIHRLCDYVDLNWHGVLGMDPVTMKAFLADPECESAQHRVLRNF